MPTTNAGFDPAALGQLGPTLWVHVGYDPHWMPGSVPNLPQDLQPALIDTGATIGGIDSALALALQLPIVDVRLESGVSGPTQFNIHAAQIYIPALNHLFYGQFAGYHLAAGGILHRALLGRAFLADCRMIYDGRTGSVAISTDPAG